MQGKQGGNVGIFGRAKTAGQPHTLKQGVYVDIVDVEPGYIEWVRASKPAGRMGHKATVRVESRGADIVVQAGDGSVVARMDPKHAEAYRAEFAALAARGQYGVTDVVISQVGKKDRFALCLNWDQGCRDGGIL